MGLVLLVVLSLHMGIMHLDDFLGRPGATDWSQVLLRGKDLFFMVTYIVLLGAALYHGFYGLRTLVCELSIGKTAERWVAWALTVVGLGLFAYGTYAIFAAFSLKG